MTMPVRFYEFIADSILQIPAKEDRRVFAWKFWILKIRLILPDFDLSSGQLEKMNATIKLYVPKLTVKRVLALIQHFYLVTLPELTLTFT